MAVVSYPIKQEARNSSTSGATGRVVIATSNSTTTVVVPGNTSVSNLAVNSENVASCTITKIFWVGNTIISRAGGSNVFVSKTGTSGDWDLGLHDMYLDGDAPTANLVIQTDGFAIVELKKKMV